MNQSITIAGIALVILGLFIPIIGWFLLIPAGLIVIILGLIAKEEVKAKPAESTKTSCSIEEVLLDADLVTAEMEAIAQKITEFGNKDNPELIDTYVSLLKDANSKINVAENIESSLVIILKDFESQLKAIESKIADLKKSRDVYGVHRESLELKIAKEEAERERLKANVEKYRKLLDELKSKKDLLTNILNKELGSETIETIELYLKTMMKYKEKYGEKGEKKFKQNLSALLRTGISRKDALERLYHEVKK
ncbi:MAG: hypothetical protein QXJ72_07915 [Thermoproteota archaeon]